MTGGVTLLRYTIAHDSGTIINPMIVEGQVHGGTAHGIGNALFEHMQLRRRRQSADHDVAGLSAAGRARGADVQDRAHRDARIRSIRSA